MTFSMLTRYFIQDKKRSKVRIRWDFGREWIRQKYSASSLIAKILQPSSGTIQTNGKLAALLELGSGFNPDFTGIENVYLNASILGLSKSRIDQIL